MGYAHHYYFIAGCMLISSYCFFVVFKNYIPYSQNVDGELNFIHNRNHRYTS